MTTTQEPRYTESELAAYKTGWRDGCSSLDFDDTSLYRRMTEVLAQIEARAAAACPPGAAGHSDQLPYEYAAGLIRKALWGHAIGDDERQRQSHDGSWSPATPPDRSNGGGPPLGFRVECDCGYVVKELSASRAERFAVQHRDDEHDARVIPPGATT